MVDAADPRGVGPRQLPWTEYDVPGTPAEEGPPYGIGGRYVIQQLIGRGGMASVYLGRDRRLKRTIAIKILRRGIEVERFEREAVILANLRHDHIADVYDSGVLDDGRPYFVTEYLDGVNLGRLLAVAPLPWEVVLEIGLQVASALRAVHQRGVIHRDVKPENIVLLRPLKGELRVKLVDFGVARLTTRWDEVATRDTPPKERRRTQEGMALGTEGYISLAASMGQVMPETDVYALGVTLFKLCTGQHPYETELDRIHQRDIAPELAHVILRAIDVDPEREMGTAEALHVALTKAASGHPPETLDQECRAYLGRVFFRDEPAAPQGPKAAPSAPTVVPARPAALPPRPDDALAAGRGPLAPSSREELRQWVGRVLDDRFELEGLLGDGGSAVVFDAWDMRFRQRAAIKVLLPEQANDAAALQRFDHEARVLMKVRQEHLVAAFDRGTTTEGLHYLALEHLDGAHLGKIRGASWLHWPVVLEIGAQAAKALDALHRVGVLHRDVVPTNLVWVRDPGRPVHIKLIDASHCKLLPAWYERERRDATRPRDRLLTREGLIFGDRRFRPPEAGVRPPHPREDIFGLGVSLYLLLTGKYPYPAGMPAFGQTIEPVPLAEANPGADVPAELAQLVHDAIQLDPELRPESAEEFFDQWMGVAESLDPNAFHDYVLTGAIKLGECPEAQRIPDGASFPEWYKPRRGARPERREPAPELGEVRPEPAPLAQASSLASPAPDVLRAPADPARLQPRSDRRVAVSWRAVVTYVAVAAAATLIAVATWPASPDPVSTTGVVPLVAPDPADAPASPSLADVQVAISSPAVAQQSDTDRLRDALRAGCPGLHGSLRLSVRIDEHRPQVLRVDSLPLDLDRRPEHRCISDHLAAVQVGPRSTATQLVVVKL
ncbi:MAG TPA: protein kinase [Nannocystis sp.]|jgi:serine/threonine-protein kinase